MPCYRIELTGSKVEARLQWRRVKAHALAIAIRGHRAGYAVKVYELPFSEQRDTKGGELIYEHAAQVRSKPLEVLLEDI